MDKFAQSKRDTGRGALNWLREKINMPGSYIEGFFKPELDRVMTSLKELDDRIRSVLTGKKIGNAEAPSDGVSAKDVLKRARTNFNRREYMAGVADLGLFHYKIADIAQDINKFFVDVNKIHHKFLFEGLPEEYKENLQILREHMDNMQRKASSADYFIKEAGIMDFFYNIGTKRGRSLAAWEKKYPKQTKDLREGGDRLINEAQKLLDNTIINLKQMATARATRRPDEYMDIAQKIKSDFDRFDGGDKGFRAYYNNAIMPWLKIKDEIEASEVKKAPPVETPSGPVPGKVELGHESVTPVPGTPPVTPSSTTAPSPATPPANVPAMPGGTEAPPQSQAEERAPITERQIPLFPKAHQRFYESLESLSKEDPRILAKYIAKYASYIQESDSETAIELFKIARQAKE